MASDALKQELKTTFADNFDSAFDNDSDDQYFLIFGKVDDWSTATPSSAGPYGTEGDNYPAVNTDSISRASQAWRDSVGAKRISSRNIYRMISRINWEYGITFDQYNHTDDLFGTSAGNDPKRFYAYTSTGNVYKCIGNNSLADSTIEPAHTISDVVTLEDGYKWKYIYKVTEDSKDFITDQYIPVQYAIDDSTPLLNQWNAQRNSVDGSIEHINITLPTSNWTTAQWDRASLEQKQIQEDSPAGTTGMIINEDSSDDEYFTGYAIYITDGPGMGQRRRIVEYNDSAREVRFNVPLVEDVKAGYGDDAASQYKIMPDIVIDGDGMSAEILANINAEYQIESVSILNPGKNYTVAVPKIYPIEVVGGIIGDGSSIQGPTLDPIISPGYGHAANAVQDLQGDKVMIRTSVSGTDPNFAIGTDQDIRQVSLIKNPKISGGDYDGWRAGTEISRRKQLTVIKPWFNTVGFEDPTFLSETGLTGDSIMGENSKATATIQSWTYSPSTPTIGTLELVDVQGNFELDSPGSSLTRIVFSDVGSPPGNFGTGNTVKQHNGLAEPDGLTAEGSVFSWSAPEGGPYELIVDVSVNAFVDDEPVSQYDVAGTVMFTWTGTDVVERKMGELIKHYSSKQGVDFSFFSNSDGFQNLARANRMVDVQDEDTLEKSYRLTTHLIIEDSNVSPNLDADTFTNDTIFKQEHWTDGHEVGGTSGIMITGKVVSWSANESVAGAGDGETGDLYLNDVRGLFVSGGFCGDDGDMGITYGAGPDLQIGSGEVLYIQNIRPIVRSAEQEEEIKILIGF